MLRKDRYAYVNNNLVRYNDPSGHWIETAFDVISLGLSLNDVRTQGLNFWTGLAVVTDVASIAIPVVPAGASHAIRAAKWGASVANAAKTADNISDAGLAARKLVDAGLSSDDAPELIQTIANASTHNPEADIMVLGSYPQYLDEAMMEGLTYFNMPSDAWKTLSNAGDNFVWAVNKQVIDNSVNLGKDFVVATGGKPSGAFLQKEIGYFGYLAKVGLYKSDQGVFKLVDDVWVR